MALNKYMHPRNIYKSPPNFTELAIKYPEFLAISTTGLDGKIKINFQDAEALRILTKVLLKKDFDLDIDIPIDRLVPAVPLRLNYVLWLEDIIEVLEIPKDEIIYGIDIGCGATCIYPLLCNQKNKWSMLASECDEQSFEIAKQNVDKNDKSKFIQIHHNTSNNMLLDLPLDPNQTYTFTMCNPPFFASDKDLDHISKARSNNRPPPKAVQTGSEKELIVPGGEVAFVQKIVEESEKLKSRIRVFTTMLGHKSSVNPVKNLIRNVKAKQIAQTRFCQGRTMRWAIAWTFEDHPLYKVPDYSLALKPNTHSLLFIIPKFESEEENSQYTLQNVQKIIEKILDKLQVNFTVIEQLSSRITYEITAFKNTWSHQRRLRRQQKFKKNEDLPSSSCCDTKTLDNGPCSTNAGMKRPPDAENEEISNKKPKLDLYLKMAMSIEQDYLETYDDSGEDKLEVNGSVESADIILKLGFLDGSAGKDGVHQVMQYIINNWCKV